MFSKLLLASVIVFAASALSFSQDSGNNPARPRQFSPQRQTPQISLFRELGLTQDQVIQFRRLNSAARPRRELAQRHLREANRDLDAAIYADTVDEADFEARLKAFQDAQNEVARLKFTDELAIRKILSAEQLVKFRELRRRASESMRPGTQGGAIRRRAQRRSIAPAADRIAPDVLP